MYRTFLKNIGLAFLQHSQSKRQGYLKVLIALLKKSCLDYLQEITFKKGYLKGWSKELFLVKHAVGNNPTVYKLQDQAGEDIKGTFYSKEIQKVTEPESYRIVKVIRKKRDRAGNLLYFVKRYSDKFNSFVRSEDLTR